jgi:hypothetical protein
VGGEVLISMSGDARIADNQAVQGAGVYLVQGNTLHMEQHARIAGNTARSDRSCRGSCRPTGGGVYAARDGQQRAHIILQPKAAIVHNLPDNIYREGF